MTKLTTLSPRERWLLGLVFLLVAFAFGPAVSQPADYHGFADQRDWGNVPHALNVLSNLPFAVLGLWGWREVSLWSVAGCQALPTRGVKRMALWFFAGLILTAAASAYYHQRPDDWGLAVDRLGMVLAFAGLLGLLAGLHISERSGTALGAVVLICGPLAVWVWMHSANAMPWANLQFGGLLLILLFGQIKENNSTKLAIDWRWVIACYVLAKGFEALDHQVFDWTQQLVSGHSLKHLFAGLAAWPICVAVARKSTPKSPHLAAAQSTLPTA